MKGKTHHPDSVLKFSGENCGTSKLTNTDVREIRKLRSEGAKLREIAAQFNVTMTTVSQIANRIIWKHIT